MKLTYRELTNSVGSFGQLLDKELPLQPALKLRRIVNKLDVELKVFQDQANAVQKKHAKGEKRVAKEDMEAYQEEMETLLTSEVEVEVETLSVSELELKAIKPSILVGLKHFITE